MFLINNKCEDTDSEARLRRSILNPYICFIIIKKKKKKTVHQTQSRDGKSLKNKEQEQGFVANSNIASHIRGNTGH